MSRIQVVAKWKLRISGGDLKEMNGAAVGLPLPCWRFLPWLSGGGLVILLSSGGLKRWVADPSRGC